HRLLPEVCVRGLPCAKVARGLVRGVCRAGTVDLVAPPASDSPRIRSGDPSLLSGVVKHFGTRGRPELREEIAQVELNGALARRERPGDFFVPQPSRDQGQTLHLTRRWRVGRVRARPFPWLAFALGANVRVTGVDRPQRVDELPRGSRLRQVTRDAQPSNRPRLVLLVV